MICGSQKNEGADHGHEKHENGHHDEQDGSSVAPRGWRIWSMLPAIVAAVISTSWRTFSTSSATTDVLDDELDVFDDGCAWHVSLS